MSLPICLQRFALTSLATLLLVTVSQAGTVETLNIHSDNMKKDIPAVVAVPESYAKTQETLPVVYLLHGFMSNYDGWNKITSLGELADRFHMILVCPDGADSWYFDSPTDHNFRYETYVSKEVVSYIDHHYRTIPEPKGRAITGLSMGGHGAMFVALRHKETFGAAGSISGGLDIRPYPKNWNISKHIGTIEQHRDQWEALTAINNFSQLKNGELALAIDCGVDDFFIKVNRTFHEALIKQKIDHDYTERAGGHTPKYWANSLPYQLFFFQRFFTNPAGPVANK